MSETGKHSSAQAASSSAVDLSVPFGQALVQQGLVSEAEVEETVELQAQLARRGVFLRLGELLVARGVVDEETVAKILKLQGTAILVCPQCLVQFNVVAFQESKRYRCSRCHEFLTNPTKIQELAVEDTLVHEDWKDLFNLEEGDGRQRQFGDYIILGQISRGGMGIIYKARQRSLDRVVAMKVVAQSDTTSKSDLARLIREAKAVAALRHPYIVAIHEVGKIGEVDFYTMEYVEGLPINRSVANEGLGEREIVDAMLKICDAIDYAHSQNVLHRDIKPENILLDRKGNPVLIDFGIAGIEGQTEEDENTIVGSPAYLPPEYISGSRTYGMPGEVYALGATLYALLAGQPPHGGVDTVQILRKAGKEKVKNIRSIRRTVDRDLAKIVMTSLSQDPDSRYPNVRELSNDLRRWGEGEEIAGRTSSTTRAWNRVRGKVAAGLGLAVALILPLITGLFTMKQQELEKQAREQQESHDRERKALKKDLLTSRLEAAQLRVKVDPKAAEKELTRLLKLDGMKSMAGKIHRLRAEARRTKKPPDLKGAKKDDKAADKLGG